MTHTIYIEDGCHIYEIGCRNTRAEADEAADAQNGDPLRRGRFFVLSREAAGGRGNVPTATLPAAPSGAHGNSRRPEPFRLVTRAEQALPPSSRRRPGGRRR